ncbi:MAG: tetratricopeptide repeat protein [Rhodobacteraceae bacterium]|nr:tetratricopeptide repeat protein [Paracoccaceae bacterium]
MMLLGACAQQQRLSEAGDGLYPPTGEVDMSRAVDGMTVGHRLMDAGEYELALKSYYRAAGEDGLTAEVLSALGTANLRLGRLGQAENLLRQAVEKDDEYVAAWNNLGVVLMEKGEYGEAERVFRIAFALDNGQSTQIRDNLRLALAKIENTDYDEPDNYNFALVRQGTGEYLLQPIP